MASGLGNPRSIRLSYGAARKKDGGAKHLLNATVASTQTSPVFVQCECSVHDELIRAAHRNGGSDPDATLMSSASDVLKVDLQTYCRAGKQMGEVRPCHSPHPAGLRPAGAAFQFHHELATRLWSPPGCVPAVDRVNRGE